MRTLALITARGGSKGLPGKNIKPFMGLPLIAHSIFFAKRCPEISRCLVSTDSLAIAEVAKRFGAEVPFLRPAELAADDTPIWPVLRHALTWADQDAGSPYEALVLLDPTSPAREPSDVTRAMELLQSGPDVDGVISVSEPEFSPIWHTVIERDGWMVDLLDGSRFERRQEVPTVYRINGSLYLWRAAFVRREPFAWRREGKHKLLDIPEARAMSIDTDEQFQRAEALVRSGLIRFPWLDEAACALSPS